MNTKKTSPPHYRADVDGLRAVAVLAVIIFHINPDYLPGGFVGVDVFFVISGYLISLYIFKELDKGTFSLSEFYRRRIKRIVPTMMAVLFVVVGLSSLILLPDDASNVAYSGLWSLLSLANVYFYIFSDASYFASSMNEKPLLHFWSLGVEEQFYIFWPLILMLVYNNKAKKIFLSALIIMTIFSFCFAQWYYQVSPSFVYYMLPARAGELLMGAILAYSINHKIPLTISSRLADYCSYVGSAMVLLSFVLISEDSVFPGFYAFIPTLGTALIIYGGHFSINMNHRVLTWKPMIIIGLSSYSAYLWHWPITAFYRYGFFESTLFSSSILLLAILSVAWLSYLYIEKPFRYTKYHLRTLLLRQFLIPATLLSGFIAFTILTNGYGARIISKTYSEQVTTLNIEMKPAYHYKYVCQKTRLYLSDIENQDCIIGADNSPAGDIILIGDSNAAHYIGMLGAFALKQGFSFRNLQINACPPINSSPNAYVTIKYREDCRHSLALMWPNIEHYQTVIISASWLTYSLRSKEFIPDLLQNISKLSKQGKEIILIGKAPVIRSYHNSCLQRSLSFPFLTCYQPSTPLQNGIARINLRLKDFASKNDNIEYYDANHILCKNNNCSAFNQNGEALYFDESHLSITGSWKLGKQIIKEEGVPYPFNLLGDGKDHIVLK